MENVNVYAMVYKHRANKRGEVPIVICITLNRRPVAYDPLKKRVLLSDWDDERREVKAGAPNATLLNALIRKRLAELDTEFTQKQILGITITQQKIKAKVKGTVPGKDFYEFCRSWLPQKYKNKNTLRTFNNEVVKLQGYQAGLTFADIYFQFLTRYKNYLTDELKNQPNTVWKTMKFINTMFCDAVKMGLFRPEDNPFRIFDRGKYQDPDSFDLKLEHCDQIEGLLTREDVPEMARKVAVYFLLMAYSGLRFEDAMGFDPAVHIIDDGRLHIKTEKFGVVVRMKLSVRLQRIVALIPFHKLKLPNGEFNKWLKVVFGLAGLPIEEGRSHNGRHLFGMSLAEAGVPIKKAQKLLGHKDVKSTEVYYHIKDKGLDRAIDQINEL